MIKRLFIILLEACVLLVIVAAALLFWASRYVDSQEFRQQFTHAVEQVTGQKAVLDGELNIALYPSISLEILDLKMLEGDVDPGNAMARFDSLRVSVRLIPLLSKRLEIRSVFVGGMRLQIAMNEDGQTNWQPVMDRISTLLSVQTPDEQQFVSVSLDELDVANATIAYHDLESGQGFSLRGVDVRTGGIEPGVPVPFTADSRFALDGGEVVSEIILKGMIETPQSGDGFALREASIYASVGGGFLPQGANPGELTANVDVNWTEKRVVLQDIHLRFLGLNGTGMVTSGDLSKTLSSTGHLIIQDFNPSEIIQRYYPKAPLGAVDGLKHAGFRTDFEIDENGFSLQKLTAVLDDLKAHGSLGITGYSDPQLSFKLQVDTLNLDRYIPLFMTDSPFIWGDFKLEFFRSIKAKGTVSSKALLLGDTRYDAVSATASADDGEIAFSGLAQIPHQGPVGVKGHLSIGQGDVPTLSAQGKVTAGAGVEGFSFLNRGGFELKGATDISVDFSVNKMDCPVQGRSIEILRYLNGELALLVGKGEGRYAVKDGTKRQVAFSSAKCVAKISPVSATKAGYYGFRTYVDLRGKGSGSIRTFAFSAQGPIVAGVDAMHAFGSGLAVKASASGSIYGDLQNRLSVSGAVAFDTEKHELSMKDIVVRTLDATAKGMIRLTDLHDSFKGTGHLDIPGANVRRIVYLLTKFGIRTKDTEVLKKVGVQAEFSMDESGFSLSQLEGMVDDTPFNGQLNAQGFFPPRVEFSIAAGKLDLDRYLPPSSSPTLEERRAGRKHKAEPVDLPLAFLRALDVNGKAWFEEFKLADIRVQELAGSIFARDGKIDISDITGRVHDGRLKGELIGLAESNQLTTQLKLHIEDMMAGPLMIDMAKRPYVKGKTDVDIDLTSFGRTDDDILAHLDGKAWVRVNNGSFKFTGYDVKPTPEKNQGMIGTHDDPRQRRTIFQKAMAYFSVVKGVFTVDKFRIEAPPLLQSYGSGSFSLPDNTINLSVRNDFVAVPSVTITVTGELTDPEVHVPKGKIVDDTVRNILSLPEKSFEFLRDLFQ